MYYKINIRKISSKIVLNGVLKNSKFIILKAASKKAPPFIYSFTLKPELGMNGY